MPEPTMSTTESEHYIGVDIGTGSARVCIVDRTGDIKAVASKDIRTWQPQNTYYVSRLRSNSKEKRANMCRNNLHLIFGALSQPVLNGP